MKTGNNFTKKDIVAALVCFIFLLANIAAIGTGGRMRAKEAVCLSNLYKWGQIFQAYTADNDGYFHSREIGSYAGYAKLWHLVYKPYYRDPMMRFCPTAVNPYNKMGTFGTWNTNMSSWDPENYPIPGEGDDQTGIRAPSGSYGMNRYIENMMGGSVSSSPEYWRRTDVKGGANAPVLMDCQFINYWASSYAAPPAYEGDYHPPEMHWICINRHTGYINTVFLDFSARKVGLKELWTLKHSRTFNTCGPWTTCGGVQPSDWPEWMRNFKDY
ncbi:MAG: hypothetical protein PHQ35_01275 [Phycisphaerae bacterium]|nr:hypothetical protein [Phycisphaerae bacterium]MDD5381743.1 hypothetical protein [Phycisphaerae bacterium]